MKMSPSALPSPVVGKKGARSRWGPRHGRLSPAADLGRSERRRLFTLGSLCNLNSRD